MPKRCENEIHCYYFLILPIDVLKVAIYRKKISCENVFWKEIETKMPKFRDIANFKIPTTPDWN
jgi:hypothetical protein